MYHLQKAARVKSQSSSRRALCMPGQVSSVCVVQNNSGQTVNIAVFFSCRAKQTLTPSPFI